MLTVNRGTQCIVSVNYQFRGPLIPSDFLKRIVTLNFRDIMEKFSVCCFGIVKVKMLLWEPKKGQLAFLEGL